MLTTRPLETTPPRTSPAMPNPHPGKLTASAVRNPGSDFDLADIALLTRGDTAALGRLFDRYARTTFATAYQILQDAAAVSVLATEVVRLHGALDTLPHDQRQASSMAYFSGLTHLEIATRTVAPLGTVKRRVRLGLRQLRDSLEDSGAPLLRSCNQSETM